jgi:hypothetical protein
LDCSGERNARNRSTGNETIRPSSLLAVGLVIDGLVRDDGFLLADDQIAELEKWAKGLAEDDRAEVNAAARAILLLANDLWAARSQLLEDQWIKQALEEQQEDLERTLLQRLRDRMRGSPRDSGIEH